MRASDIPLHLRFWDKVQLSNGCWLWMGARQRDGYGSIGVEGRNRVATHVMWFLRYGYWPKGIIIHSCDNPPCVNPVHLSDSNHKENIRQSVVRGRQAQVRKTHCSNGHPFDDQNTYFRMSKKGPERRCRKCFSARGRENRP